jgi:putative pyoverdin transport system ATP-binding/permease protein
MQLVLRIFRTSLGVLMPAILAGILAANAYTAMIALIHQGLQGNTSWLYVGLFIGAMVVYAVSEVISRRLFLKISLDVSARIREEMTRTILRTPLRTIEKLTPHRLFGILHGEIEAVASAVSDLSSTIIRTLQLIGLLVYFAITAPQVLFVALVLIPAISLIYLYPASKAQRFIDEERRAGWRVNKRLEEAVFGFRELAQDREKSRIFIEHALRPTTENARQIILKNRTFEFLFSHLADVMLYGAVAALIFIGGRQDPANLVRIRDIVLFALVLKDPARTVIEHSGNLYRANIRLKRIADLGFDLTEIYTDKAESKSKAAGQPRNMPERIELRNVTYSHLPEEQSSEQPFSLGPINMTIEPGKTIYIVGGNGSGKTTLIKILCGLYQRSGGEFLIDGVQLETWGVESFQSLCHVIFADFFMFEQIHLAPFSTYHDRATALLEQYNLHQRIKIEQSGHISDINLSTGQRKRVAMITSVLDEWAADQDPEYKKRYYTELIPEMKALGKMIIIVSHDDQYFYTADKIIKLQDGKIAT